MRDACQSSAVLWTREDISCCCRQRQATNDSGTKPKYIDRPGEDREEGGEDADAEEITRVCIKH